ncbi:MAG: hypothetical protein KAS32_30925 [Candidatus Peribacteraceae bacterium]|nr:hypothetical protein [Candidatus Peribacteraceae bacterium]
MSLKDGVPCDHPGCLHHVSSPCEGCGRNGGKARKPARLSLTLVVNCPNCEEEINLADSTYEGMYIIPVFNNKLDDLKDETVVCTVCNTEFQLARVEL